MKKNLLLLLIFIVTGAFGQGKVAQEVNDRIQSNTSFKPIAIFEPSQAEENSEALKAVSGATFATLNKSALADLTHNKYENIELQVPYQGRTIEVQLYRANIFAEGFHLDTDKSKYVAYEPGIYYRGIVKGDSKSVASVSFFEDGFSGIISADNINNLVVGKLERAGNDSDYIIYSDANMKIANTFKCDSKEDTAPAMTNRESATVKCVTMFLELDYSLYVQNGSSTTNAGNWATAVFNNVQTLYANDGISTALKSFYIWTTQDPYHGSASVDYLNQFNEHTCVFDGDVGQLLGIDQGALGGIAVGINGLCTEKNFSYSDVDISYNTVPVFSWTVQVITHEFGHLLGSPHTHTCFWNGNNTAIDNCAPVALGSGWEGGSCMTTPPTVPYDAKGTIMSYCHLVAGVGINLSNGFGPQPKALIANRVNNANCLGTDCSNTCINSVCSVEANNITTSTATITWNETNPGTTQWKMSIRPFSSTTDNWTTVSSSTFNASGLLPNTYYRVKISPICGSSFEAPTTQTVFLTSGAYCSGITLTDTGGISGQYENNQNFVRTLIPNLPNKKITITFTQLALEDRFDFIYLYDGDSTSAPELSGMGFTGYESPGTFTSSASDGSLTMVFSSDGGVTDEGYVAEVSCENALQIGGPGQYIDVTYFPNPTNGLVKVISKTAISQMSVYNISGQLLYDSKIGGLTADLDMSAYAAGTYFFKLRFDEKEVNFRVMKM